MVGGDLLLVLPPSGSLLVVVPCLSRYARYARKRTQEQEQEQEQEREQDWEVVVVWVGQA
jgi:hypothetical protein